MSQEQTTPGAGKPDGKMHRQESIAKLAELYTTAANANAPANDICPMCGGELDTSWECNDCGFDAIGIVRVNV